jgi:fatty-acyl-CoA synthase
VWPAELETVLYRHPAVLEACVIASPDAYRGETVKALIVLRDPAQSSLTPADLIAWMREQVAAYKVPRRVEFVDSLPKSPVGKILWRELQDAERQPVADSSVSSAT